MKMIFEISSFKNILSPICKPLGSTKGTIFKEGDAMTVWVTDDENRVPVKVETPILIGTVKVYLKKASGLKFN